MKFAWFVMVIALISGFHATSCTKRCESAADCSIGEACVAGDCVPQGGGDLDGDGDTDSWTDTYGDLDVDGDGDGDGDADGDGGTGDGGTDPGGIDCDALNMPDQNLEAEIRDLLELPEGHPTVVQRASVLSIKANELSIADLTGLECYYNVNWLEFNINEISSIAQLVDLDLNHVEFNSNKIVDLSPVLANPKMKVAYFADNAITDISVITEADWGGLQELDLSGNEITDLTPLASGTMNRVELLKVANNLLENVADLSTLIECVHLDLSGNLLTQTDNLNTLVALKRLLLAGNAITDYDGLDGLGYLDELDLSGNGISDLSGFGTTDVSASNLNLSNNELVDIAVLQNKAFANLNLSSNEIVDLTPLANNNLIGFNTTIDLTENPFDCDEQASNIASIRQKDVSVTTDCP